MSRNRQSSLRGWTLRGESARRVYLLAGGLAAMTFLGFVLVRGGRQETPGEQFGSLSATPSLKLLEASRESPISFADGLVEEIRATGRLTVTVHVGLADGGIGAASRFTDGGDYRRNLCWGALYGVETHLANAGGWRRAYTDSGTGDKVLRRVVFHRRAELTAAWQARGVDQPFDVYVLACAWPARAAREAMERPILEAMTGRETRLHVDGFELGFGGESRIVGYLGPNPMADGYWDIFEKHGMAERRRQIGVFFICSMSAVYLQDSIVQHGLYPVLLAREPIVPEAYLLDGMLKALLEGELDDGFVQGAAMHYARYQKGMSRERAARMLFR